MSNFLTDLRQQLALSQASGQPRRPSDDPPAKRSYPKKVQTFEDSLQAITGNIPIDSTGDMKGALQYLLSPKLHGFYTGDTDSRGFLREGSDYVSLKPQDVWSLQDPSARGYTNRETLAHEFGHVYQNRGKRDIEDARAAPAATPLKTALTDVPFSWTSSNAERRSTPVWKASEFAGNFRDDTTKNMQVRKDKDEHFAEVFGKAILFLQENMRAGEDAGRIQSRLAEMEKSLPGIGRVVNHLLATEPVYSKHPMRVRLDKAQPVQPDAMRVYPQRAR